VPIALSGASPFARHLAELNRHCYGKRYPPSQFDAGITPTRIGSQSLSQALIKLTQSLPDGRLQIVALLFPSYFLGRPFAYQLAYGRNGDSRGALLLQP
jgi:hypothetical protein